LRGWHRWLAGVALSASFTAWSSTVTYTATDLADAVVGQDLWQYTYKLKGPLAEFNSVNLIYSPSSYDDLALLSNSDPGSIDVVLTQPDAGLPADGQATLLALLGLTDLFEASIEMSFVWLGSGAPGAQPLQVLDEQFNVISEGRTTATTTGPNDVPEPSTVLLAALALALAGRISNRTRVVLGQ
jgi:hypothetical protein